MYMAKLRPRQEGTFAIIAAIIVLFSAMLDPQVSLIIAIAALVLFSMYSFMKK